MKKSGKPVLCCASGGKFTSKISKIIEGKGIPVYPTPRRAVSSFGTMVRYMKKEKNINYLLVFYLFLSKILLSFHINYFHIFQFVLHNF